MSCRNQVSTHLPCSLQKCIELDFTIAEHIRVRSPALGILVEHVIDHALTIFITQVNEIERDTDFPRDHLGHEPVFFPLAVSMQSTLRIMPVLHEHGKYVITLLLQKQSSHT